MNTETPSAHGECPYFLAAHGCCHSHNEHKPLCLGPSCKYLLTAGAAFSAASGPSSSAAMGLNGAVACPASVAADGVQV